MTDKDQFRKQRLDSSSQSQSNSSSQSQSGQGIMGDTEPLFQIIKSSVKQKGEQTRGLVKVNYSERRDYDEVDGQNKSYSDKKSGLSNNNRPSVYNEAEQQDNSSCKKQQRKPQRQNKNAQRPEISYLNKPSNNRTQNRNQHEQYHQNYYNTNNRNENYQNYGNNQKNNNYSYCNGDKPYNNNHYNSKAYGQQKSGNNRSQHKFKDNIRGQNKTDNFQKEYQKQDKRINQHNNGRSNDKGGYENSSYRQNRNLPDKQQVYGKSIKQQQQLKYQRKAYPDYIQDKPDNTVDTQNSKKQKFLLQKQQPNTRNKIKQQPNYLNQRGQAGKQEKRVEKQERRAGNKEKGVKKQKKEVKKQQKPFSQIQGKKRKKQSIDKNNSKLNKGLHNISVSSDRLPEQQAQSSNWDSSSDLQEQRDKKNNLSSADSVSLQIPPFPFMSKQNDISQEQSPSFLQDLHYLDIGINGHQKLRILPQTVSANQRRLQYNKVLEEEQQNSLQKNIELLLTGEDENIILQMMNKYQIKDLCFVQMRIKTQNVQFYKIKSVQSDVFKLSSRKPKKIAISPFIQIKECQKTVPRDPEPNKTVSSSTNSIEFKPTKLVLAQIKNIMRLLDNDLIPKANQQQRKVLQKIKKNRSEFTNPSKLISIAQITLICSNCGNKQKYLLNNQQSIQTLCQKSCLNILRFQVESIQLC